MQNEFPTLYFSKLKCHESFKSVEGVHLSPHFFQRKADVEYSFWVFPISQKNKPDLIPKSRNFSSLNSPASQSTKLKVCLDMDNVYALG